MQAADAGLQHGAFALGADDGIHLPLGLLHHLLDMGGMDAAVGDQLFQRKARHLAAYRLEAGHRDGFRRIVDDQVCAGQRLDGADVAALAADDAALHLVIGQGYHTDGDLGHMVGGAALDSGGHDLTGAGVGFFLGAGFDLLDLQGSLVGNLRLHLRDQVLLGFLGGKAGDALQHFRLAALDELDLLLLAVSGGMLGSQRFFLFLDLLGLVIEVFFLLLQTALLLLQVGAAFLDFLLVFVSGAQDLLLRFHQCFAFLTLAILDGFVDDAQRFLFGILDLALVTLLLLPLDQNTSEEAKNKRNNDHYRRVYDFDHGFLL